MWTWTCSFAARSNRSGMSACQVAMQRGSRNVMASAPARCENGHSGHCPLVISDSLLMLGTGVHTSSESSAMNLER